MEMTIIFFVIAATLTAAALLGRSRRRRRGFARSHEDPYAYAGYDGSAHHGAGDFCDSGGGGFDGGGACH
jgi:hypothetical protein